MSGKVKKPRRTSRPRNVKRVPAEKAEARDEGPRLLPLDTHSDNESQTATRTEYYLKLAHRALGIPEEK